MTTSERDGFRPASGDVGVDFRAGLWRIACALQGGMDVAEWKHDFLDLILIECVLEAFEEPCSKLEFQGDRGADPGGYRVPIVFRVPSGLGGWTGKGEFGSLPSDAWRTVP